MFFPFFQSSSLNIADHSRFTVGKRINPSQETSDPFLSKIRSDSFVSFQALSFKAKSWVRLTQLPPSLDCDVDAGTFLAKLRRAGGLFFIIHCIAFYPGRRIIADFDYRFNGLFEFASDVFFLRTGKHRRSKLRVSHLEQSNCMAPQCLTMLFT